MLDVALTKYQTTQKEQEREEARSEVFCISCKILGSLFITEELQKSMETVFSTDPASWGDMQRKFIEKFDEFLIIENEMLLEIGIADERARARMLESISGITSISVTRPADIISRINALQAEACRLCRVLRNKGRWEISTPPEPPRRSVLAMVRSVMGVGVAAANIVGAHMALIDPSAAELSCTLGGLAIKYPDL
jgi:hypothetical protein